MQCKSSRADGSRCEVTIAIDPVTGYCGRHAPEPPPAEPRDSGVRTIAPEEALPPPKTLQDVTEWASWATVAVATGKIDARTAREIATLLEVLRKGQNDANKVGDRIARLEAQMKRVREGVSD
jgi:hypothetical protein